MAGSRYHGARGITGQGDQEREEEILSCKKMLAIQMWLKSVPRSGSPLGRRYPGAGPCCRILKDEKKFARSEAYM